MKLAYCIHSLYNSGGTERVLTEKVNALHRDYGYDITVITADQRGLKPFFALDPEIKTVDVGINFYKRSRLPRYMKRLEELLSELRPDICISLSNYEIYGLAALKDGSVKVAEFHFTHDRWFLEKGRLSLKARIRTRRLEKSLAGLASFVVLSREDAAIWEKVVVGTALRQIYNPSPFAPEQSPLTSKEMIAIGRLCRQKDFPTLIRAWSIVHGRHSEWKLNIYGDGPDRRKLERLVCRLGLEEVVLLNHRVADIKSRMAASSALLMSSIYEGFPMSLVEGASLGLPLISTACKYGPSEIISEGENGYLVPVGDSETMADRICRLIENPDLLQKLGAKSLELSSRFSSVRIISQWDALFRDLKTS